MANEPDNLRRPQNRPSIDDEALTVSQSQLDATTDRDPPAESFAGLPSHVSRYRILRLLGAGAFGCVYEAFDPEIDRRVAVKVSRPNGDVSEESAASFRSEAKKAASLKHPNIVTVFDAGRCPQNGLFIVTELVEGCTLKDLIREAPLTPEQAARLVAQVASALAAAHQGELVHRDIKPANILVDQDGKALVADFGLALPDREQAGERGVVSGTLYYMSPEQIRGDAHLLDGRSDIWSLGVVLYECLTGRRPFGPGNLEQLQEEIPEREPKPLRQHNNRIPEVLETICNRCLAKKVSDRYSTATDLQHDLEQAFPDLESVRLNSDRSGSASSSSSRSDTLTLSTSRRIFAALQERPHLLTTSGWLVVLAMVAFIWMRQEQTQSETPPRPPWFNYEAAAAPVGPKDVTIVTEPPGAQIVVYPLSLPFGFPDGEERHTSDERTPLTLTLDPGQYLVVAALDDGRFHEVYRTVPQYDHETPGDAYAHLRWKNEGPPDGDGKNFRIRWLPIKLFDGEVSQDMAYFEGSSSFGMGSFEDQSLMHHTRFVAPFYLDTHEVTWNEFLAGNKGNWPHGLDTAGQRPPQTDEPMAGMWFNDCVSWLEKQGKRLPLESEYELAATAGGHQKYPWGDDASLAIPWQFGEAGQPEFDVSESGSRPVFGLYSNVAEWTYSWGVPYPSLQRIPLWKKGDWVIRGGPREVITGEQMGAAADSARGRVIGKVKTNYPGVGFRGARSAQPRLEASDLERVVLN